MPLLFITYIRTNQLSVIIKVAASIITSANINITQLINPRTIVFNIILDVIMLSISWN